MSFLQTRVSEKASVQVAVRVRPLNQREDGTNSIVETKGSTIYIKDPETNKNKTFNYDYTYSEESTQEELHKDIGTYVINNAYQGYNTCVFAYGQTGCFAPGTQIMTITGVYKNVEDVQLGDILMGDDSTERKVIKLFRGQQYMYKITTDREGHQGYTVNADHILLFKINPYAHFYWNEYRSEWAVEWFDFKTETLKKEAFATASQAKTFAASIKGDIIEKTAAAYYSMPIKNKKHYSLYTTGVDFREVPIQIDPYEFGAQLKSGLIPQEYKYTSRSVRLQVLAGLINSEGQISKSPQTITGKSKETADDIAFVARSLGFYTTVTLNASTLLHTEKLYNVNIYESETNEFIPEIKMVGIGYYHGFMLDGNHRFIGVGFNVLRNSGKSHSVMGSDEQPGLIPRVCQELFKRQESHNGLDTHNAKVNYKLEISYLEIYSEDVRDLLSRTPTVGLRVREHPEFGPYVEGLQQILVEDYKTIKKLIDQGNKERVTASTLMNHRSSRSHAILTLYFTQLIDEPDIGKTREVVSKINLVDLAGSERVEMSGVTGINFKEAININKSLSTLGLVISKLAAHSQAKINPVSKSASKPMSKPIQATTKPTRLMTGNRPVSKPISRSPPSRSPVNLSPRDKSISEHVPYRDSVLTWILKESLGGNSKTFMIATVSPSDLNYNESLSTLRYAANAKQIVNTVKINEDPNDKLIRVLKDEIDLLKRQLITRGSDSTSTADDLRTLRDEIAQREELMREKDKSWEQKLEESKRINDQVQEQLKKELSQKQVEFRQKLELMNSERENMLKEMESLKTGMTTTDIKQQKDLEEEFQKKQAEFEKDRILGTAVSLQEYYEKKLEKMKEEYDQKSKDRETTENTKSLHEISDLKDANIKLKEELNKNQRDLQLQIRQFTNDRLVLSKQIQQLHNKIHSLEQNLIPILPTNEDEIKLRDEYQKISQLRNDEEKKYQTLQTECRQLDDRINTNKEQLTQLEIRHTNLLKDVEIQQVDLIALKSEYSQLVDKFKSDKTEYDSLITKKEQLHTEIVSLRCDLDIHVEVAREKLKNPTIEDLLKIKDGFAKIFENISNRSL